MIGIATHQWNAYEILKELEAAPESSHQIFNDLQRFFRQQDLKVRYAAIVPKKYSFMASPVSKNREPCLWLYINGGGDASGSVKEAIVEQWISLCQSHGLSDEHFSATMIVRVENYKSLALVALVYACKPLVVRYFDELAGSEDSCLRPKYVFVSSEPAVRAFYKDPAQLAREMEAGNTLRHHEAIDRIFRESDEVCCYETGSVLIEFRDCETDKSSMYGFSRED